MWLKFKISKLNDIFPSHCFLCIQSLHTFWCWDDAKLFLDVLFRLNYSQNELRKIYAQDPLKISSHWFSEQNSILKAYHYELSFISPLTRDVKNSIGIISIINILRQPINFLRVFLTKSVPPEILGAGIGKIHFTHALELKWYYKSKKLHLQHPSKSNHPKKKQKTRFCKNCSENNEVKF